MATNLEEKIRKLRIIDTNVPMSYSESIYLLTGNYLEIPGFEEALAKSELSKELLGDYANKEPHDLLIPCHLVAELDGIKKRQNSTIEQRISARDATISLKKLLKLAMTNPDYNPNKIDRGEQEIILENGAKVFFQDLTAEDVKEMYNSVTPFNDDLILIYSGKKFLKNHKEYNYENSRYITDDQNATVRAMLKGGFQTENFRFTQVNSPLQENKGIAVYDVNYKIFQELKNKKRLELDQTDLVKIDSQYLDPNHIIDFRQKKRFPAKGEKPYKSTFMIHIPNTNTLRALDNYDRFLDFITNYPISDGKSKPSEVGTPKPEQFQSPIQEPTRKYLNPGHFLRPYLPSNELNSKCVGVDTLNNINEGLRAENILSQKQYRSNNNRLNRIIRSKNNKQKSIEIVKLFNILRSQESNYITRENQKTGNYEAKNKRRESKRNAYSGREQNKQRFSGNKNKKFQTLTLDNLIQFPFNPDLIPMGEQLPYIDHLLNNNLTTVSIDGKAGFGKTIWAIAAGLYQVCNGYQSKILYFSPLSVIGGDIGYLKGGKEQKIEKKVNAARLAVKNLFGYSRLDTDLRKKNAIDNWLLNLEKSGILTLDVITDIAGETYDYTYGIMDEGHVLTQDEAGMTIGRFGKGSKLIFLSGIEQLGASVKARGYLNERTAGIAHMAEKLPIYENYAHLTASPTEIYRGPNAILAERLTDRTSDLIKKINEGFN